MDWEADDGFDDREDTQRRLNELYEYGDDLETKVQHRKRINLFMRLLAELRGRGLLSRMKSALDVGCNAGAYCGVLSEAGFEEVTGVDVCAEAVEAARASFGGPGPGPRMVFVEGDARDVLRAGTYDFILCTEVVEHVDDPDGLLEAVRSALAPSGIAVMSMPNVASLPYALTMAAHRVRRKGYGDELRRHLSYPFWRSALMLTGEDLEVVGTSGSNLFLCGPLLARTYGTGGFRAVNTLDSALSRRWPFKHFAQFVFVVARKRPPHGD